MLEDEEDEKLVDLLSVDENDGSIMEPCGGCGQGVIEVHRCPGCDAHMYLVCRDIIGKEGYGQKVDVYVTEYKI